MQTARYLYAGVGGHRQDALGPIGLDGAQVYLVAHRDISVAVHDCPARPYTSGDTEAVKAWVLVHQGVIDQMMARYGTVLPMGFNTIVQGDEDLTDGEARSATVRIAGWLEENRDAFVSRLQALEGRREYGVQVFHDYRAMLDHAAQTEDLRRLADGVAARGKGTAYLLQSGLDRKIREEAERRADALVCEIIGLLRQVCADLVVDKVHRADGEERMLINLSVLLQSDRETELGEVLENLSKRPGLRVRFTGPWAPFSFVETI
jgi:hypothetical protein